MAKWASILLLSAIALMPLRAVAQSFGACVVRDDVADTPNYSDPSFAAGYAKSDELSSDLDALSAICTDDVFQRLMQLYCSCSLRPESVQWEVVTYNSSGLCAFNEDDGTTCTVGCAASGCDFHSCEGVAIVKCSHSIAELRVDVDRLVETGLVRPRNGNVLLATLRAAESSIRAGRKNAARAQLAAFIASVEVLRATNRLPRDWAEVLVSAAASVSADL